MVPMFQDDRSSSVTSSSPLQFFSMSPSLGSPYPWLRELKSEERGLYLIHLLITCANHVAAASLENANIVALEQISLLAWPDGDTMQRIAAYFTEALAYKIPKAWPGLHKALNSTRITMVSEEILIRKLYVSFSPSGFILTYQAIVEAMEGDKMVRIVELNAAEPAQWIALLQTLSTTPKMPLHLMITTIYQQKEVLNHIAHRLTEAAEKLDIPLQFFHFIGQSEDSEHNRQHFQI